MLQLLIPPQLHRQIPSFRCLEECNPRDLSRRKWSPATTGPPEQLRQIVLQWMVPQTNYGFHGWSALPQVVARQKTDQLMVEIYRGSHYWQQHLITTPWIGICCNSGSRMSNLGSDSVWCCHKGCHTSVAVTMHVSLLNGRGYDTITLITLPAMHRREQFTRRCMVNFHLVTIITCCCSSNATCCVIPNQSFQLAIS